MGWAGSRQCSPSRRLRELPDLGKRDAALRWWRRAARESTTGRWRAHIVIDEESDFSAFIVISQIVRGNYHRSARFCHGDPGTINPRPEPRLVDPIDPSVGI